jgi:hypothetical protein
MDCKQRILGYLPCGFTLNSGTNMTVNCELGIDGTVLDGLVPVLS